MSGKRSEPDARSTLYDPPEAGGKPAPEEHSDVELELGLPPDLAAQLQEVSTHLGLSPSIVASRAIGMVCAQIGLVQSHDLSSETLIQKYQTRLDLLHRLEQDLEPESDGEAAGDEDEQEEDLANEDASQTRPAWGAVDEIIERAEGP